MCRGVILFDLDGTLVDSACDIAVALSRLSVARGGPVIEPDAVRPLVSHGASTLVRQALGAVAGDPSEDLASFRALLRDVPHDPTIVYPGVRSALARLHREQWRLAVVTNKPHALAGALLEARGLMAFFAAVVGGDTAARPKPDAAPLRYALQLLGNSPREALFVGDSQVDATAAASLAIPLLLYAGGYGDDAVAAEQVAARFALFDELPALADSWRERG